VKLAGPGDKLVLGVVHLLPLPDSPRFSSRAAVLERARADADALVSAGLDGFVVENFGDAPFHRDQVPPSTIAEMTAIVAELRIRVGADPLIGINVLRNDACAALSIAAATGSRFIRVNVHSGVAWADQGTLEGRADETLRLRRTLDAQVAILADVAVKHSLKPPGFSLTRAAKDLVSRGLADGVIVTGDGTGETAPRADLVAVRSAVGAHPVFVGSGVNERSIAETLTVADGVIVGTSLKERGDVSEPVSRDRARRLMAAVARSAGRA
jgi:hypothetical protein